MNQDILVFVETRDGNISKVGLELLGEANKLNKFNNKVIACVIGYQLEEAVKTLKNKEVDEIYLIDDENFYKYNTLNYASVLFDVIKAVNPNILLIGATSIGRDLAPRVSSRMNTGLTADCTKLDIDEATNVFGMTIPAFGGNLMATIVCPDHRPQMATVRPGVMQKLPREEGRKGEIEAFPVNIDTSKMKVKILDIVKETSKKIDITEAKILVSGGRGVGSKENFKNLEAVASKIGATVSGSRAAVDAGFIEQARQVGQTGKTVRPNIYFACGISGAIQHMAGMEESEYIIAINKDKDAPMFGIADLGIARDVNKVLPLLAEELAKAIEAKKAK